MKRIIPLLGLLLALNATAQETVKTTANKFNGYGIVYSLPTTAIDLQVTTTRSVEKVGPFSKYAQKYLGVAPTVTQNRTVWTMDKVTAVPKGIPDPEQQYAIQLKSGNQTAFYLTPDGLLAGINAKPECNDPRPHAPKKGHKYTDAEMAQLYTEDMLLMGSTAKMAEAAAKQIYAIREYRLDLLTGNADVLPTDASLKIILREMARREALLTELFMGSAEKETMVKHVVYMPDTAEQGNRIAFRFSEHNGVVGTKDLSGEPVYVAVTPTREGTAPTNSKGHAIAPSKGSLAYTIPGYADVKVSFKGKTLFNENLPFAQLGVVYGLDASLLSGKNRMEARFCPQTGALLNISTTESNKAEQTGKPVPTAN